MAKEFAGPDARQKFGLLVQNLGEKVLLEVLFFFFFLFYQDHCLDGVFIKFLMFS